MGRLDLGPEFYAASCFVGEDGRPLLIAWSPEARSSDAQVAAGWSGVMTLPREVAFDSTGRLGSGPAKEFSPLRGKHWREQHVGPPNGVCGVRAITVSRSAGP